MKLKPGTILEITWVDTHGTGGWESTINFPPPPIIKSVGFYIAEAHKGIYLASGLSDQMDGEVLAPCWIPRGTIKKIRRLR